MTGQGSGYKHSGSDRKLDQSTRAEDATSSKDSDSSGPGHDPARISRHDDTGKDRLFEGREQRDHAEKASEKNRLSKDVARHNHQDDEDAADSGTDTAGQQAE